MSCKMYSRSRNMYFFCIYNQQPSVFQLYAAENRVLYFLSFLPIPFYISGGQEARISPRCSIHVICKKEKIKRFFCGFLERQRKNEGICSRQQNATGACRVSRPANTPARLAAWIASQNYVLLFQPAAFIPASAGQHSQTSRHLFYIANLSLPAANIIPSFANPCRNQSAKITAKESIKKGSRSFLKKNHCKNLSTAAT